jgi:hypothetical protein
MAEMGAYCKAYTVEKFRAFSGWKEELQNLRKEEEPQVDGEDLDNAAQLRESAFYYLQENFVVTDGIFIDQNIIFNNVTPEWVDYCRNVLQFNAPE